jgi:hypothetical protein
LCLENNREYRGGYVGNILQCRTVVPQGSLLAALQNAQNKGLTVNGCTTVNAVRIISFLAACFKQEEIDGTCSTHGVDNAYDSADSRPEGKIPLERPRRRWENNIKIDLRLGSVVWSGFIWLGLKSSEHGYERLGTIKDGEFFDQLNNYKRFPLCFFRLSKY